MNRRQKIITTSLWILFLACTLVLVVIWSGTRLSLIPRRAHADEQAQPPLFDVPAFQLVDQRNQPLSSDDLRGTPWVADFIFTRCPGPCPIMSSRMSALQKTLPARVRLISFTIDAEHDTPEVLADYARKYEADAQRWHFLTGDADRILHLAEAMKIGAQRGPTPVDMQHGTHFVLVNGDGKVHGYYRHDDAEAQQQLVADATALAKR